LDKPTDLPIRLGPVFTVTGRYGGSHILGEGSPRKCGQGPLAKACGASLLRGCAIHRNDR
ncbi:MAG: hypothetical protein ACKN82_07360, partial [Pirellula sp.]